MEKPTKQRIQQDRPKAVTAWEHLGNAIVDSGRMVVSDPNYAKTFDAVCFQPGRGDGEYPVYALRDSNGHIVEVRVRLTSTDEMPECPPNPPSPYTTVIDGEPCLVIGEMCMSREAINDWFDEYNFWGTK
jgi:hypothetical protein